MKRIFSLILALIMIFALSVTSVTTYAQEPSVSIVFPTDGTTIANEQCEVSVETSAADEIVYEFDGVMTPSPILTAEMLTLGEHTLTVYVISETGDVSSATSNFKVQKIIENVRIETGFDDLTSKDLDADVPYLYKKNNSVAVRMTRQASKAHASILSLVEGPNGEDDIAVNATSPVTFNLSRPYFLIEYSGVLDKIGVVEHDIMVNNLETTILHELKATGNASWYPGGTQTMAGGKFFKSDYTYEAGVWYHLTMIFDFNKRIVNVYAKENGSDEEIHVLVDDPLSDAGIDINTIRCVYFSTSAENSGLSIDNVRVRDLTYFNGIEDIVYYYDEDISEDEIPDAEKLTAIGITPAEKIKATNLSGLVKVTNKDGKDVKLSSITEDADSNTIVATFESPLEANSEYFVRVGLAAVNSGTVLATDIMEAKFKTVADSYGVNSVNLSVNGSKVITGNQLSGKSLKCGIEFSNSGDEDEKLSVVLSVINGDKFVGLALANIVVPAGSNNFSADLETSVLDKEMSDVTVQVIFVDNFMIRKPVFSTYEIKY